MPGTRAASSATTGTRAARGRLVLASLVGVDVQRDDLTVAPRDSKAPLGGDSSLALIVADASGVVVLAEGALLPGLGLSDEAIGKPLAVGLAHHPRLRSAMTRAMSSGRRTMVQVPANDVAVDVAVEGRRGGGAVAVAISVGAQRDVDRELGLIFRQVPGSVWSTDRRLTVTHAFGRVARELSLEAKNVIGSSVYDVLGTRDPNDPTVAAHLAALSGLRTAYRIQFRKRRFAILTEPLRDKEQRIVGTVSAAIDVTSATDAEERFQRSQAMLADAQRVAHVGSWEWDVAANRVTWSAEMYRIHGLEESAFGASFESFLARVAPDDIDHTKEVVFGAFRKPGPFVYDHRIVRPDGSVRILHTRGDVLVDGDGNPQRMLGTCWDVTAQSETQVALERTASLLQATLESTADGVVVVARETKRITAFNQPFVEMWAVPTELVKDAEHIAFLAFVVDQLEDPSGFMKGVQELDARPEKHALDVVRFRDGRVFERVSRPQRLGDEIVGRVWSFRDVSVRERLLQRAVFLGDAARLLSSLDIEQALTSVARLSVPFLGESCAIDLFAEGPPRRMTASAREQGRTLSPELSPAVLSGQSMIYTVGAVAHLGVPLLVSGNVSGAITIAAPARRFTKSDLDVAEELARRVAVAIERQHLLQRAHEALHARDEFLAIAAHEIRGPITALHAAVQALLRGKIPEHATRRVLELIEREDRRLSRFVEELLDLGMSGAEAPTEVREPLTLARVVRDVVSQFQHEIANSGSMVALALDEQVRGMWDRERLEKVVAALVSNAVKYGLGKPIEISVRPYGDRAELRVLDHGMGIAKDAQSRIFAPFERAVSARHYGGLGLGLHIACSIVKGMGGTISVESEPAVGSIFVVELERLRSDRLSQ